MPGLGCGMHSVHPVAVTMGAMVFLGTHVEDCNGIHSLEQGHVWPQLMKRKKGDGGNDSSAACCTANWFFNNGSHFVAVPTTHSQYFQSAHSY